MLVYKKEMSETFLGGSSTYQSYEDKEQFEEQSDEYVMNNDNIGEDFVTRKGKRDRVINRN